MSVSPGPRARPRLASRVLRYIPTGSPYVFQLSSLILALCRGLCFVLKFYLQPKPTNVEDDQYRSRKALRKKGGSTTVSRAARQPAFRGTGLYGATHRISGPGLLRGPAAGRTPKAVRTGRRNEDPQPPRLLCLHRCDMPAEPALGSYLATTAGALPMGPAAAAPPAAPPGAAPAAAALNTGRLRWGGSRFFRSSTERTRTTRWWMAASTE